MQTKHEQAFYQELETLRYPEDIQRIEHIRHSLAAIRYKQMQKRWFMDPDKPKRKRKAKPVVERPNDILCADCLAVCTLSADGKRWLCPNPEHN